MIRGRELHGFGALLLTALLAVACGGSGGGGGTLEETARPEESASADLWLNSGGLFFRDGSGGSTIQGELGEGERWQVAYAASSSVDTDGGRHPQNLFRLVTRQSFRDMRAETELTLRRTNASASPNRNQSNGIFLFLRYQDGDNVYTAGLRVDGAAVVKKKINGQTLTIAEAPLFPGTWSRDGNPNLIPEGRAIALAAEIEDVDGGAAIRVFVDGALTVQVVDDAPIPQGFSGLRSDFMDVEFSRLTVTSLD